MPSATILMNITRNHRLLFSLAVVILLLMFPLFVAAQHSSSIQRPEEDSREYRGFQFGFNIGLFLPNAYSANYYNGKDGNENNIKFIFGNKYQYEDLYRLLNVADTFFVKQFPTNMHYPPTASAGLYIGFNFNRKSSMYVQFNYAKLKPHDVFTVEVDPKDYLTEPDLRLYTISGVEERINIDLGYSRNYPVNDHVDFVASAGLAINDSKVLKAVINIENKEYSIVNVYGNHSYVPGSNMQEYQFTEGGLGIGLHGGGGFNFNFANNFALQPGITLYWNNVNLEGYKDMKFSTYIYVRIIALNIL
jgi:hypothetical protein